IISTAAAASRASSGFPPRASAESTTRRGRQRFPPVLNMYLMIWLASRLSKFAFNVLLIVFSMGSRQASSEGGNFLISADLVNLVASSCAPLFNRLSTTQKAPVELYVDAKNKLYSENSARPHFCVEKNGTNG